MSVRKRELLTLLLVFGLAAVSFAAGFVLHDVVGERLGLGAGGDERRLPLFWEAWGRVEESFLGDLPADRQLAHGAIRGALATLDDPYTLFVEPAARELERQELSGRIGGVGASLQRNEAGQIVLSPVPDNPAIMAGVLEGDILLAVDGQTLTAEMSVEQIAQLVRGEEGTPVSLRVLHPGATEPVEITITRAIILLPSVSFRMVSDDPPIGYIRLSRFSAESGQEVAEAIQSLQEQGADGLILDLRQNGGGLLDAAVEVSDHFLDAGPVVYQVSGSDEEELFESTDKTLAGALPLLVLIDGGTASASEIVAGALQDRGRARLVGAPTFGKGSVQLVYDLSDGSSVHVTSARWYTPDRHQIDQQGLKPDIVVEPDEEATADGRDVALEEAIRFLSGGGS
ncbi:MAG: S41 family peptidase [Candidatus Promineifilaceae bacterium]